MSPSQPLRPGAFVSSRAVRGPKEWPLAASDCRGPTPPAPVCAASLLTAAPDRRRGKSNFLSFSRAAECQASGRMKRNAPRVGEADGFDAITFRCLLLPLRHNAHLDGAG